MPVKLTNAEITAFIAKGHKVTQGKTVGEALDGIAAKLPATATKPTRKKRDDDYDSQAESDFAAELESLKLTGQVKRWIPHPGRLRLSDKDPQTGRNRHYHPDFLVEWSSGYIEWIEVKGRMKWEDAVQKFDWTRTAFPMWHFRMVERIDGEWVTIRGDSGMEII